MKCMVINMAVNTDGTCIKENQIQNQSRKIAELEAHSEFKDQRITDLTNSLKEMDNKIDKINDNVNQLVLQSRTDDKELELRLKAIETELVMQKQATKDNYARLSMFIAILTILFTGLTFYFNFMT